MQALVRPGVRPVQRHRQLAVTVATWEDHTELLEQSREAIIRATGRVYLMLSANGQVLYVGQTTNLPSRMGSHAAEKPKLLTEAVELKTRRVLLTDLNDVEGELIHEHHPVYNNHCPLCRYYNGSRAPRKPATPGNSVAQNRVNDAIRAFLDGCGTSHVTFRELADQLVATLPRDVYRSERSLSLMVTAFMGPSMAIRKGSRVSKGWHL